MLPGRFRAHASGLATALIGAVMLSLVGYAQTTDRAPLGWDDTPPLVGNQEIQRVLCPRYSYLVGFREVLGYWLYETWPVCAPIDRDGAWIDGPARTSESLVNVGGLGATGVDDFLVTSQTCPPDSFAFGLTGVIVRAKDESAGSAVFRMPGLIRPICHKRSSPIDLSPTSNIRDWRRPEYQGIPWASFEEPEFIGWRGFDSPSTCRPDEVAVGAWSVRDQWIRSVGLICEAFERMRPRTAVESGAGVTGGTEVLGLDQIPTTRGLGPGTAGKVVWTRTRSESSTVVQSPADGELELKPPRGGEERTGVGDPTQGVRVRAECPSRSAMTSVWVVGDDRSLQTMQIWCHRVDPRGLWSGPTFRPSVASVMLTKGFAIDDDSVFERLRKMDCPAASFVAGFNPGVSRVGDRVAPWQAFTECRNPSDGAVTEVGYAVPPGSMNENRRLIGWDGVGGPRSCNADEVGIGIWGAVSRDYVEALGLVCAPWTEVRAISPVEAGAGDVTPVVDPSKATEAATEILRAHVPIGTTYVVVNNRERKVREFSPGETTGMGPECVPVVCPTAIVRGAPGKQVACWRCGQH